MTTETHRLADHQFTSVPLFTASVDGTRGTYRVLVDFGADRPTDRYVVVFEPSTSDESTVVVFGANTLTAALLWIGGTVDSELDDELAS